MVSTRQTYRCIEHLSEVKGYIKVHIQQTSSFHMMLSLMHILFQPSIANEAAKALAEAIESINMDGTTDKHMEMEDIFKQTYTSFAFSRLPLLEPNNNRQVHDLPKLWEEVDQLIDRDDFHLAFASHCKQLDLPHAEFDLTSAFIKAQIDWACDLMLQTANFILRWNEDVAILSQAAFWEDGNIIVDTTKCKKYKEWLINNYLCELTDEMTI